MALVAYTALKHHSLTHSKQIFASPTSVSVLAVKMASVTNTALNHHLLTSVLTESHQQIAALPRPALMLGTELNLQLKLLEFLD